MSRRSGDELSAPLPAKRSKVVYALATPRSGSLSSTCRQRRLGWHRACLRALRLAGPNGSGGTWRAERRAVRRTRAAPPVVVEFAQSPPSQGSGGKPPPGTAACQLHDPVAGQATGAASPSRPSLASGQTFRR
jgi:hypothetical protein